MQKFQSILFANACLKCFPNSLQVNLLTYFSTRISTSVTLYTLLHFLARKRLTVYMFYCVCTLISFGKFCYKSKENLPNILLKIYLIFLFGLVELLLKLSLVMYIFLRSVPGLTICNSYIKQLGNQYFGKKCAKN